MSIAPADGPLRERRVLVTGGLGFIGHHLVRRLVDGGASVVVVDDLSANVVPADFFDGSVEVDALPFTRCRRSDRFDWVCHLASPVGPLRVMTAAGDVAESIVSNARWLIERYRGTGSRLLYVSTSEVYGTPGASREDQALVLQYPFAGRREYACAKLLAEVMLTNAERQGLARPLIVRPFNIVGPRQSEKGGFVIPRFVGATLRREPLTVYGDGSQERCFTDVSDLVEAMVQLMGVDADGIYNVCNAANRVTIAELARRFQATVRRHCPELTPDIVFVDPRRLHGALYEEAVDKVADISKLLARIAWQPRRSLHAILEDAVADALRGAPAGHPLVQPP